MVTLVPDKPTTSFVKAAPFIATEPNTELRYFPKKSPETNEAFVVEVPSAAADDGSRWYPYFYFTNGEGLQRSPIISGVEVVIVWGYDIRDAFTACNPNAVDSNLGFEFLVTSLGVYARSRITKTVTYTAHLAAVTDKLATIGTGEPTQYDMRVVSNVTGRLATFRIAIAGGGASTTAVDMVEEASAPVNIGETHVLWGCGFPPRMPIGAKVGVWQPVVDYARNWY